MLTLGTFPLNTQLPCFEKLHGEAIYVLWSPVPPWAYSSAILVHVPEWEWGNQHSILVSSSRSADLSCSSLQLFWDTSSHSSHPNPAYYRAEDNGCYFYTITFWNGLLYTAVDNSNVEQIFVIHKPSYITSILALPGCTGNLVTKRKCGKWSCQELGRELGFAS